MPDEPKSALIDALARLPLRPGVEPEEIEFHALLLEYDMGQRPKKQSTTAQAVDEIIACQGALAVLQDAMAGLSPRARAALAAADATILAQQGKPSFFGHMALGYLPLEGHLRPTAQVLAEAAKFLRRSKSGPERGRKSKARAESLAQHAARAYYALTGKRPTRRTDPISGKDYGPFLDLVRTIFELGRVEASAERFARLAVESFQGSMDEIDRPDG